ncbi:MAG TPA: hypothetical protein VMS56_11670 [Thermoanaerobaculia bacterium]|nr:hypothetical protein [Thermoanaerobaculia bacterium]
MWDRLGGEQSERQWRDVIGVLRVSGPGMDRKHLVRAAAEAGVSDLLDRAWLEAESPR